LVKQLKNSYLTCRRDDTMDTNNRRNQIMKVISESDKPISARYLANMFHVSRQIVVGDIALLRAKGIKIIATPRGYLCEVVVKDVIERTIAVVHKEKDLAKEIYAIIDLGGEIIDVIVEHPLYGELRGNLHLASRYDADEFLNKVKLLEAKPLSNLTQGLHLHTIRTRDEACFERILNRLEQEGFLYHNQIKD
ncbi:MAG: transcription repressor NadR, partial [Erysipelotrichaceae bacterium]